MLTQDEAKVLVESAYFVTDILKRLHEKKCPRVYLRAYMSVIG